jgi:ATP-binding cassette subfamily C protein
LLSALAKSAEQNDEKSEISDLPKNIATGAMSLSIKNVSVIYGNSRVINDISLEIPAGGCVALVGPSGSGKSTLVDALLGLVSVQSGGILINSTPLSALPISAFRKRVGYMGQDTILFEGSIRHNLMWGASLKNANIELLTALNLSEAAEFIGQLPAGLDTLINKNGVKLSGGERQRIGLARALMGSPGLLILDEATSALDAETEGLITEALHKLKGKVTILIVAHRLSSVRYADHICVLEKGEIIESGSWENLQKNGTRFNQLWNLQTSV